MKNKKGELTTQQIIGLIVLITSFAIILLFIFRLDLGETTNKEICHNSVLIQSQSALKTGGLDCKTNYVCISGGEDCEGINPTTTRYVNPANENEIMGVIADEMADCWWMFGEGKVDYVGDWISKPDLLETRHCAICSIVKFDSRIQERFPEITSERFYNYLFSKKFDDSQTYLKYLYNLFSIPLDGQIEDISTREKYSVVTGMKDKEDYIRPYFIKTSEIEDKTPCEVFDLTKA